MAKLIINPTSGARKEIPIGDKILSIGRDPSNDLVLSDAMVSRRHAIMERRGDGYIIRDNNSSNGTLVNGDKVLGDQTLRDGDLIAIGAARLLFQLESGHDQSAKPISLHSPPEGEAGPVGEVKCASCGLPAVPADRFCRGCGKELPTPSRRQVICAQCSSPVLLPADYCGTCGKPLLAQRGKHHVPTQPRPWVPPLPDEGGPSPSVRPSPSPRADGVKGWQKRSAPVRRGPAVKQIPAGFWIRFAACWIDSVLLSLPLMLVFWYSYPWVLRGEPGSWNFIVSLAGLFLTLLLAVVLYHLYFWSTRGATPGKGLFRLKVVAASGESPLGVGQAMMRLLGYFINVFTFGIGFLLIAFTEDKRGLHDRLAETKVVRR